jgi:hypothetical protein
LARGSIGSEAKAGSEAAVSMFSGVRDRAHRHQANYGSYHYASEKHHYAGERLQIIFRMLRSQANGQFVEVPHAFREASSRKDICRS